MNGKSEGWKREEVELLFSVAKHNSSLLSCFKQVAERLGRKEGSVRNFYYKFLKTHSDEYDNVTEGAREVCLGKRFDDRETRALTRAVLLGTAGGKRSVRGVLMEISSGDPKLFVRLQNKYRNTVQKDRVLVTEVMRKLDEEGLSYANPYAVLTQNGNKTAILLAEAEKLIADANLVLSAAREIIDQMKSESVVVNLEKNRNAESELINRLQNENAMLKSLAEK